MTDRDEAELEEILRRDNEALMAELGVSGYIRVYRAVASATGDYTEERRRWLATVTIEDARAALEAMIAERERPATPTPTRD